MKLEELDLDVAGVVGAPVKVTAPQPDWVEARNSGAIPLSLFNLYEAAAYLSFGAAPRFLADPNNVLFSYFGMLLRGIRQQLSESAELLGDLQEAHGLLYDPIKKAKGLPWDPSADRRSKRAFRDLVASAYSALDMLAELVALMFTDGIPNLTVGRAQFVSIEEWLRKPINIAGPILAPKDVLLSDLHAALTSVVTPDGPEQDWLPLVRLLRGLSRPLLKFSGGSVDILRDVLH